VATAEGALLAERLREAERSEEQDDDDEMERSWRSFSTLGGKPRMLIGERAAANPDVGSPDGECVACESAAFRSFTAEQLLEASAYERTVSDQCGDETPR